MSVKEHAQLTVGIVWYVAVTALLLFSLTAVGLWLKPTWLGFERAAFKSSHQYIEAKELLLLNLGWSVTATLFVRRICNGNEIGS